jgi:hypothetical protein
VLKINETYQAAVTVRAAFVMPRWVLVYAENISPAFCQMVKRSAAHTADT